MKFCLGFLYFRVQLLNLKYANLSTITNEECIEFYKPIKLQFAHILEKMEPVFFLVIRAVH